VSVVSKTTGIAEIDAKLAALASKSARRVARKATNAGLKVITDKIRLEIKTEPISPQLKRALLRTVGRRFKRDSRSDSMSAKAGLGVGKKSKPAKRSGKNKGGVGLTTRNLHWFALGTIQRLVTTRRGSSLKRKRYSGRIKAVPAVARAGRKAATEAISTIRRVALEEIANEVKKL
jgi:hypothetical protein